MEDERIAAAVASLFRAVHTIKGMSATMGYDAVATLSHEMEALLDRLRRGELAPDTPLMDTLFEAADALEASIERAVAGQPADARLERIAAQLRDATAARAAAANGRVAPARKAARPSVRARSRSRAGAAAPRGHGHGQRGVRHLPTRADAEGADHRAGPLAAPATFRGGASRHGGAASAGAGRGARRSSPARDDSSRQTASGPDVRSGSVCAPDAKIAALDRADVGGSGDVARVEVAPPTCLAWRLAAGSPCRRPSRMPPTVAGASGPATSLIATRHVRIDLRASTR